MKNKINVGDIVVYVTMARVEAGRIARISKDGDMYKIVPLEKGHFAKKRKKSELLSLNRLIEMAESSKKTLYSN